jgi:hypothetical protein
MAAWIAQTGVTAVDMSYLASIGMPEAVMAAAAASNAALGMPTTIAEWAAKTGTEVAGGAGAGAGGTTTGPVAPDSGAITSTGISDSAPGTVFNGPNGPEIVLDSGKTVNLADYNAALNSGQTITVDGAMTTGGSVTVGPAPPGFENALPITPDYSGIPNIDIVGVGSTGVEATLPEVIVTATREGLTATQIAALGGITAAAAVVAASGIGGAQAAAAAAGAPTPPTAPTAPTQPAPAQPTAPTQPAPTQPAPAQPTTPTQPAPGQNTTVFDDGSTMITDAAGNPIGGTDSAGNPFSTNPETGAGYYPATGAPTAGTPTTPVQPTAPTTPPATTTPPVEPTAPVEPTPPAQPPAPDTGAPVIDKSTPIPETGPGSPGYEPPLKDVVEQVGSGISGALPDLGVKDALALAGAGTILGPIIAPPPKLEEYQYGPLPPIQWGTVGRVNAPGLNPGLIGTVPQDYQTTSPVQSKFYYGPRPYQTGTQFDPAQYAAVPKPAQPYGLQQAFFETPQSYDQYSFRPYQPDLTLTDPLTTTYQPVVPQPLR